MKFEYTHQFETETMLKAQTELCSLLYSKKVQWLSLLSILAGAMIAIFGMSVLFGFITRLIGFSRFDGVAMIIGIIIGALLHLKLIVPRINAYFYNKRRVEIGGTFVSNYTFDETGIVVIEDGRRTEIDWSAISSVEQTNNYIGLLCLGLFYYLPRGVIGDQVEQDKFISKCSEWVKTAKTR
jgi:hypothetical protein